MDIRKQGHCAYQCEYHLVLVSKYRREIFNTGSCEYFKKIMGQVQESLPEIRILTVNHGEPPRGKPRGGSPYRHPASSSLADAGSLGQLVLL